MAGICEEYGTFSFLPVVSRKNNFRQYINRCLFTGGADEIALLQKGIGSFHVHFNSNSERERERERGGRERDFDFQYQFSRNCPKFHIFTKIVIFKV